MVKPGVYDDFIEGFYHFDDGQFYEDDIICGALFYYETLLYFYVPKTKEAAQDYVEKGIIEDFIVVAGDKTRLYKQMQHQEFKPSEGGWVTVPAVWYRYNGHSFEVTSPGAKTKKVPNGLYFDIINENYYEWKVPEYEFVAVPFPLAYLTEYYSHNHPTDCIACRLHGRTYSATTHCHTYWYDYCRAIDKPFGKLHAIFRGEYRHLSKHDEDDLMGHLPYECPYFDSKKIFWEMYGRIKMHFETFIYECAVHMEYYYEWYVYALPETIKILQDEIPPAFGLHYLYVKEDDRSWFITTFGENEVLISDFYDDNWVVPPPPEGLDE